MHLSFYAPPPQVGQGAEIWANFTAGCSQGVGDLNLLSAHAHCRSYFMQQTDIQHQIGRVQTDIQHQIRIGLGPPTFQIGGGALPPQFSTSCTEKYNIISFPGLGLHWATLPLVWSTALLRQRIVVLPSGRLSNSHGLTLRPPV